MIDLTDEQLTDFWSRIDKPHGDNACWPWKATNGNRRYGQFMKTVAHRIAWEIANGDIPDGLEVCHSCDNPPCCNPDHLFLGTHQENMQDYHRKRLERGGTSVMTPEQKAADYPKVSFRLSSEALIMLSGLSESFGVSRTSILEMLIRERAKREKIKESKQDGS